MFDSGVNDMIRPVCKVYRGRDRLRKQRVHRCSGMRANLDLGSSIKDDTEQATEVDHGI